MSFWRSIVFLIILFSGFGLSAQSLFESPLEYFGGYNGAVKVVGNTNGMTSCFVENSEGYELIWYDSVMQKLGSSNLEFLERGAEQIRFYPSEKGVQIFYQKRKRNLLELWAAEAIPVNGDTIRPIMIDSVELSGGRNQERYIFYRTDKLNRFMYAFYQNDRDVLSVQATLVNSALDVVTQVKESVADVVYHQVLDVRTDGNDGVHILFGEPARNDSRMNSVLIGSLLKGGNQMSVTKLNLNGYLIGDGHLEYNNVTDKLYLGGLLYQSNSPVLNALALYEYSPSLQTILGLHQLETNRMSGLKQSDITNVRLRRLMLAEDGGCSFVLEKTFEEIYQRNRNIGFVTPGLGMGSSSYSVFHNDEIYVFSMSGSGSLNWYKEIPKAQETTDGNERFHSFGSVESSLGSIFLFTDQSNRNNRFVTAFLSREGNLKLRQFGATNYPNIEDDGLLLRGSTQITANAVVFPIIKRGTLSFAKIVF